MTAATNEIIETKFLCETRSGSLVRKAVTMEVTPTKIIFLKSPFELKDEIKAMKGSRWMGYDQDNPVKAWSVANCPRNWTQIEYLNGENDPFAWFDRDPVQHDYSHPTRPAMWSHQVRMADNVLTYHFQILAACPGAGKTRTAFEVMERSGKRVWWWVGPKTTLFEIALQADRWGLSRDIDVRFMTYDAMVTLVKTGAYDLAQGVIFDEASKLKTAGVGRSTAAQELTDRMRAEYGMECYVVPMSGTPSPKSPVDIWSIAEITYPGYLREGSPKALEKRLGVFKKGDTSTGGYFDERVAWLDEDGKCRKCGLQEHACRSAQECDPDTAHKYEYAENEIALLNERLQGLITVVHKHECQELPEKNYIEIDLEPSAKLLKLASAVQRTALSTVQGLNQLRQLSDGFLYTEQADGMKPCPTCAATGEVDEWFNPEEPERPYGSIELMDPEKTALLVKRKTTCCHCGGDKEIVNYTREAEQVPCPKADALIDELDKAADIGRICIAAGYQGSVDRVTQLCREHGWMVFRCDGRGSVILNTNGTQVRCENPLSVWKDLQTYSKVAFVANPESGGFGLTLTEACTAFFYSNSYKPEFRLQFEERVHRPGQTRGVRIVDAFHLPSDRRVLQILRENRKLEQMVLGDVLGDCFMN